MWSAAAKGAAFLLCSLLGAWCSPRASAQVRIEISATDPTSARLSWPAGETGYSLEAADRVEGPWHALSAAPNQANGRWAVDVAAGGAARFFRLHRLPATVASSSPAPGESGVSATRETILRFAAPLASDAVLTTASFLADAAGSRLLTRPELSSDRRTATLFYLENLPAATRVRVTLNTSQLRDDNGLLLDGDGDGEAGGSHVLEFDTAGTDPLTGTAVVGHVYASEKRTDGSNRPLANVTITVDGAEETLRTVTDNTGAFTLSPVPAGRFFVHVDGRTAVGSQWPSGAYYPFVGKAWETVAGRTNNLAGGSGEIFLPRIEGDALKTLSATDDTRVTFSPSVLAANPALAGVEITVPANDLFSDNGARGGKVGMAPVPPDRLPEPLPPGLNFPLVITIQTDGGANFDRPVPVRFPNLPDPVTGVKLGPGEKTLLWSFNHDTGRWEPQGTMTISADGQFAVSDPGVGVRQPGWHGAASGSQGNGPEGCQGDDCDGPECGGWPPACCADWEEFKKPCKQKQRQALWAVFDLAVDDALFLFGSPGGCKLNTTLSVAREARDCYLADFDKDSCETTVRDGTIGNIAGCIPGIVGGTAGLAAGAKSVIDGAFAYQDCLKTLLAACGAPVSLASTPSPRESQGDPRLARALTALRRQIKVSEDLQDVLRRILGNPVWAQPTSADEGLLMRDFSDALATSLSAGSPGGSQLTAEERAALLARPFPAGATLADAGALIDRLVGFGSGLLKTNLAIRAEVNAGYDALAKIAQEVEADGWPDFLEGLRRGVAEFTSMSTPRPDELPPGRPYYYLRDLDSGFVQRGQLSPQRTFAGLVLRPDTFYAVAYFDPIRKQTGATFFRSAPVGNPTRIPAAPMFSGNPALDVPIDEDGDHDFLSDHAEIVRGTNPHQADTDGDGLVDGLEITNGTDPLDGMPATLGVIAAAKGPGPALAVYARGDYAFVASGTAGLAVFQLQGFTTPTLVAQLALGGKATTIAGADDFVALGVDQSVAVVDVANPLAPRLIARPDLGAAANAVAVRAGQVAAALANGDLVFLDATQGSEQQRIVDLDTRLDDLQFGAARLFVVSSDELIALERVDGWWSVAGRLAVSGSPAPLEVGRKLAVNGDLAWVGYFTGFTAVDVHQPTAMSVLGAPPKTQLAIHDFALTGSGSLAAVTSFNGELSLAVSLYDVRQPTNVTAYLGSFQTGGAERALTVHQGRMLVAATAAGLQVVNFLSPDLGTSPPTVDLAVEYPGAAPRADFGGLLPVTVNATDDVAIRSLELEVDGVLLPDTGGLPYYRSVRLPSKSSGRTNITLRARATDPAGNLTWTSPLVIPLVDDATPPQLASIEPLPASSIAPGALNEIRLQLTESPASPITSASLTLLRDGPDGKLGTADDVPVPGTVAYDPASHSLVLTTGSPLAAGHYQATLAAGLADTAGNLRARPFTWTFQTGAKLKVTTLFPPANYVRVGGMLDELAFTFSGAFPSAAAAATTFRVYQRNPANQLVELTPIDRQLSADGRTFTLHRTGAFPAGSYRVTATGSSVQDMIWDFTFRVVPNEAVSTSVGAGTGLQTNWKYPPGPGVNDELIVDLPGRIAPIPTPNIRSLLAKSDVLFLNQTVAVPEPIQCFAGLEVSGTRFGAGTTHVRGGLLLRGGNDVGPHVLNAYGGGIVAGALKFGSPDGALINHPDSLLVVSNTAVVASVEGGPTAAGRFINLGHVRTQGAGSLSARIAWEGVRLRNDGQWEIADGEFLATSLEHEGVITVAAGAKLILSERTRGGPTSRIEGEGALEFGRRNPGASAAQLAEAEIKGEVLTTGPFTVVAGNVTLWRPLTLTGQVVTLQNGSLLKLLSPAQLGPVSVASGTLSLQSDSRIERLTGLDRSGVINTVGQTRVTGDAAFPGLAVTGPGVLNLEGTTVVSNATQTVGVSIGHATLRNLGLWRQAGNGAGDSEFAVRQDNGRPGEGGFENLGRFEMTTDRTLVFRVPFRNLGVASLSRGPVVFDARTAVGTVYRGAFRPEPGSELILNETDLQHHNAGTLDLAAGTVRGTGKISAVNAATRPRILNRGVLRPGRPTGDLTLQATDGFEQTAGGELVITLSADGPSRLLLPSTPAKLAGRLRVELADGFLPNLGQSFTVLTCSARNGEFDQVVLPTLSPDRKLAVTYQPTSVVVTVVGP